MTAPDPTGRHDGAVEWVVTITVTADAPEDERDAFFDHVADAVHSFEPRTGWDPFMMAHLETSTDEVVTIGHQLGPTPPCLSDAEARP